MRHYVYEAFDHQTATIRRLLERTEPILSGGVQTGCHYWAENDPSFLAAKTGLYLEAVVEPSYDPATERLRRGSVSIDPATGIATVQMEVAPIPPPPEPPEPKKELVQSYSINSGLPFTLPAVDDEIFSDTLYPDFYGDANAKLTDGSGYEYKTDMFAVITGKYRTSAPGAYLELRETSLTDRTQRVIMRVDFGSSTDDPYVDPDGWAYFNITSTDNPRTGFQDYSLHVNSGGIANAELRNLGLSALLVTPA